MTLAYAKPIALALVEELRPHCERIHIAGSIRREKPLCRDIEVVAIPKPYQTGLFADGIAEVISQWEKIKGELPCKYTQRRIAKIRLANGSLMALSESVALDLFFACHDNYGYILALRTGSAEFNMTKLMPALKGNGYHLADGFVHYAGKRIAVPEELDLFRRAGMSHYIEPKMREA